MTELKHLTDDHSGWDQPTAYERWYASPLGRCYGASLEAVLHPWLSDSTRTRVLDVGCGPGLAVERLFGLDAEVWGIDCSFQMACRARARARESGQPRCVIVGTVAKLPFGPDEFELVSCINCLEFVADRRAAFQEISRVLLPGGTALIAVLNRRSTWELTRRLRRPLSRSTYYRGRFFNERDLRMHCAAAGLRIEEIQTAVHFPPVPPGPFQGIYQRWDRRARQRGSRWGGVLLCRAVKAGTLPPLQDRDGLGP